MASSSSSLNNNNTKPKCMTTERGANRLLKSYQCRSKKKLRRKSLVRQAKQEKENKYAGDHLTLIERFNMFEVTAALKRLCPSVKREYAAYWPMTDLIYTRWERTPSLKVTGVQQTPTLILDKDSNNNNNDNQSKSKVGIPVEPSLNVCSDHELLKKPTGNVHTTSPLPLRKDIAAIVTDNVLIDGVSTLTKIGGNKCPTLTSLTTKEDSLDRRNRPVTRKGANVMKARSKEELSSSGRWYSLRSGLSVEEEGSGSPTSFGMCPTGGLSTPAMWTTNIFCDKRETWNRNETETKNLKSTKGLLLRKVKLSILSPTFVRDSKNESFTKSLVLKIIPDEMDSPEIYSLKENAEPQRNRTSRVSVCQVYEKDKRCYIFNNVARRSTVMDGVIKGHISSMQ